MSLKLKYVPFKNCRNFMGFFLGLWNKKDLKVSWWLDRKFPKKGQPEKSADAHTDYLSQGGRTLQRCYKKFQKNCYHAIYYEWSIYFYNIYFLELYTIKFQKSKIPVFIFIKMLIGSLCYKYMHSYVAHMTGISVVTGVFNFNTF